MSQSMYDHLRLSTSSSIRLVSITPGYPIDELECQMTVVHDLASAPAFEALSYVWGANNGTVGMKINGEKKYITSNLADALSRLRPLPSPTEVQALDDSERLRRRAISAHNAGEEKEKNVWGAFACRINELTFEKRATRSLLWIDALCINQDDKAEKTVQVRMMRKIYERADSVNVWLGVVPHGDLRIALSITAQALANFEEEYLYAGVEWKGIEPETVGDSMMAHGFFLQPDEWAALSRFYDWCAYFKRIWILQEVACSRSATVFANDFQMDWNAVGTAALWLSRKGYEAMCPSLQIVASLWTLTKTSRQEQSTRKSLADLMLETVQSQSTDRRDRVFALLGLSSEGEDPLLQALINYDDGSEEATFIKTARYLLDKLQTLEPLSLASSQIAYPGTCTWAPAWRGQTFRFKAAYQRTSGSKVYAASRHTLHTCTQTSDIRVLSVHGFNFDTIIFAGERGMAKDPVEGSYFREIKAMLEINKSAYDPAELMHAIQMTYTAGVNEILKPGPSDNDYLVAGLAFTRYWLGMKPQSGMSTDQYRRAAACENRRFVITERGYLGLAPEQAKQGDMVAILYGGELPMILRAIDESGEYQFVGESYVHGLMSGEALDIMQDEGRVLEVIALR
ncbi:hypothetical protein FKW77_010275 [Venturia effusa]|uniref:Heterokaryon incompatibility domain-containing protein n=1 Tax=Venturia effusa TaxID=50376 RepID=A0A517L6E5_9PEZI|nr:hypothetical protein FKW77_010275 [Venturia effusa]